MKNLPVLFLGVFFVIAFSFTGIVLVNQITIGQLQPAAAEEGEALQPGKISGLAMQGKHEYVTLGCMYCHSQQVRRKGFGVDYERGWGDRQSIARDYIRQERVLLGTMRTGPDLKNVGQRLSDVDWHMLHLYNPRITTPGSNMPAFAYLFKKQKIDSVRGPSPEALNITLEQYAPELGYEIVPTSRAKSLVAYLLSLRLDYDLPELKRE